MRKISLIVIHCSATRVDRDFTAKDVEQFDDITIVAIKNSKNRD